MLKNGSINPAIQSLFSRVPHTNRLVLADRKFPFWPEIKTIYVSVWNDQAKVLTLLRAIVSNLGFGPVWTADQFRERNRHKMEEVRRCRVRTL